ncbi:MAG: hypothetical protein A3F68_13185 [Acidobacteria bacterium RIFCSPLOWO2_12_FULL_54_10]|nr:MAG: hypothetical protein A3F68_13185 [Acidobacteria bacterium RIFCSPLOWO2_12_FULL_54_10]
MTRLLEYLAGNFTLWLLGLLPRSKAHHVAGWLSGLFYSLTPRFRRIAHQNLRMAMPELSDPSREAICRDVYRSLGRLLAEFAHFPRLTSGNVHQAVSYDGLEHYEAARSCGRGVLFLTAHLGAWELGAFAHALYGYPMQILYRPLDNSRLDALVNRYRLLSGNKLIDKRNAAREVLSALARNETVGILADQNTSHDEGVFVDFFGISASTTAGVARIALHTGAVVVPAFCVWIEKDRRFRIIFDSPIEPPQSSEKTDAVRSFTQQMAAVIERYIRRYPDQWLWIHRRWKTRPPGEPPLYS